MKKKILGFSTFSDLVDNRPGVNSELGELTTWCATYSREKGEYYNPAYTGMRVVSFSVKEAASDLEAVMSDFESIQALKISKAVYDYAKDHIGRPIDPKDLQASIQTEFFSEIADFQIGDLRSGAGISMPGWISWTSKLEDLSVYRLWIADKVFEAEYPEFHITVIPPIKDLRVFLGDYDVAVNAVKNRKIQEIVDEAQDKKNLKPETFFRLYETDYVNRLDSTIRTPTTWGVLIYGAAGDNIDAIKDAIIKELLAGTGSNEFELEPLFPDLFKRTEFIHWPRWDKLSIPNQTTASGLFRSLTNLSDNSDFVLKHHTFANAEFVKKNINIFPIPYRSITNLSVNGENNVAGSRDLTEIYHDLINAAPEQPDFQRMSRKTMDWVYFMQALAIEAERATNTSVLPQGMRRVNRSGKLFITATHDGASHLMAMRANPFYNVTQ